MSDLSRKGSIAKATSFLLWNSNEYSSGAGDFHFNVSRYWYPCLVMCCQILQHNSFLVKVIQMYNFLICKCVNNWTIICTKKPFELLKTFAFVCYEKWCIIVWSKILDISFFFLFFFLMTREPAAATLWVHTG